MLGIILLSMIFVACGDGERESRGGSGDADSSAAPGRGSSGGEYRVIEVRDGGKITGRVALDGKPPKLSDFEIVANKDICGSASKNNRLELGPDGAIAYAVVYLEGVTEGKPMPAIAEGALTIDQRGCQYTPHLVAAPIGSTVAFTNSDDIAHNVRVEDSADAVLMNKAQPSRGARDVMKVEKRGPLSVGCDYHPWMNAYVFGVDNPYYAVTSSDGRFTIDGIPPGKYTVKMWLNGIEATPRKDNQGRLIRYYFAEPILQQRDVVVGAGGSEEVEFVVKEGAEGR